MSSIIMASLNGSFRRILLKQASLLRQRTLRKTQMRLCVSDKDTGLFLLKK
ncbi:hypothetical protein GCWU000342_01348 [Shuttleworthella satelles DSM 14600]|uniref:Uncharacterized protein n=1 Tax=Shuttleworthella satelles DSM 14600 TaxID=626523 RepID=C4GBP5_9FIRM|nr:hypothetical protein GCWU000342_01348 [Shuttleworthia satelles DSM 14600]